jgi:hypothetical protein
VHFDGVVVGVLIGLAAVYGAASVLLGFAWRNLLEFCGIKVGGHWAVQTYAISQLAKYVPGNVFQFASRQAIGLSAGLPGWPLAKSALWEIGLMVGTGALFGLLAAPIVTASSMALSLVIFASLLAVGYAGLSNFIGPGAARAAFKYAVFLAVSGLTFVSTLAVVVGQDDLDSAMLLPLCGVYVIAWLGGLITPGAPAGIGVRELLLLTLLVDVASGPKIALAAVLARVVTMTGDVLFFLGAWLTNTDKNGPGSPWLKGRTLCRE